MILEYRRPKNLEEALALLNRISPASIPLAGGTFLTHNQPDQTALIDLQEIGFNQIDVSGSSLQMGAMTPLQALVEHSQIPEALKAAVRLEATLNTRNRATIAGRLVTCDGASSLATVLLAMDARLIWLPGEQAVSLGDWLPLRKSLKPGVLISQLVCPSQTVVRFSTVGRSPQDRPIVCAAVVLWPSGRTRIALGGAGDAPVLAMDGTDRAGAESAVENAYSHYGDPFASSEYRKETARQLVRRLLTE